MRGLLQRLSEVDSEAEAALRVIATFDALVQHRASFGALARTTAGLVGCPVGIVLRGDGTCVRVDSTGKPLDPVAPPSSAVDVFVAGQSIASCWLERTGSSEVYDEIVLERLVVACASIWREHGGSALSAAVDVVISAQAPERSRTTALQQLGFEASTPLRVIAFSEKSPSDRPLEPAVRATLQSALDHRTPARISILGARGAALLDAHTPVPENIADLAIATGGVVPAIDAHVSWSQANSIVDLMIAVPLLARPSASVNDLGALITLSSVPTDTRRTNPDVVALAALAAAHHDDLMCLEAFLSTGSLRAAGKILHRHHSSVASRLARVAESLGCDLSSPAGASRALTALVLLRMDQLGLPTPVE